MGFHYLTLEALACRWSLEGSWLEEVTSKPSPTLIPSESLTTPSRAEGQGLLSLHCSLPLPFLLRDQE